MQARRPSALILAVGWLMACISAVALGQALRLGPAEAAYAWPWPAPAGWVAHLLLPGALGLVALTAVLLMVGASFARATGRQRPWARLLLVHPLLLAFIWLVWPASGRQPWFGIGSMPLLLAAAGLALLMVLGLRGTRVLKNPPHWREFRRDGLFLALIIIAGLASGQSPHWAAILAAAVLYPLFALAQLAVMLILPAGDLRRCGCDPRWISASCALVFGLLHWPNPLVALATTVAMFFWAKDRLAGRGLISLALGMGLLGAAFSQMLPDPWTAHLRVGPGYVRHLAREDLAAGKLWFAPANEPWDRQEPLPADLLAALYPGVVGRPIEVPELATWEKALAEARRKNVIWQFLVSEEYAQHPRLGAPPLPGRMDQEATQHWHEVIRTLDSQAYWRKHGASWPGFLAGLYGDTLGRQGSDQEIAAWTPRLSIIQRRQVLEVLLDHASSWKDQAPQAIGIAGLIAPQVPLLIDQH